MVSVRQVTQRNAGRRTAGIDRVVALDGPARMATAVQVHRTVKSWVPVPVRRVYIPKANGKAETTRYPSDPGPLPPGTGQERAGAGVGSPVRAQIVRVPARAVLSGGGWVASRHAEGQIQADVHL